MSQSVLTALFPPDIVTAPITEVALDSLPPNEDLIGPDPSASFVADVRKRGVRSPIMLVENGRGGYTVCYGTRRIKAARVCRMKSIPAQVYPIGYVNPHSEALAENNQRDENIARDVAAIADLREQGHTDETIQKDLRLNASRFKSRCKILDLPDRLLNLLYEGRMSGSAAEEAAKLTAHLQDQLLEVLREKQEQAAANGKPTPRLTATDVREVSRTAAAAARASVDPSLFATPDAEEEEPAPDDPRKLVMDAFRTLMVHLPMDLIREADALCGKYVAWLKKEQPAEEWGVSQEPAKGESCTPFGEAGDNLDLAEAEALYEDPMALLPIQTPRVLPEEAPQNAEEPVQEAQKKRRGRNRQDTQAGSLLGEE